MLHALADLPRSGLARQNCETATAQATAPLDLIDAIGPPAARPLTWCDRSTDGELRTASPIDHSSHQGRCKRASKALGGYQSGSAADRNAHTTLMRRRFLTAQY